MAKKEKKEKKLEETLWDACCKLRGNMTSIEYMSFTLGLVFLKFATLKFEARRQELLNSEEDKDFVEFPSFYAEKGVFFIPEKARYSYIKAHAKDNDIGITIDEAFASIEDNNPELKGCLPIGKYGSSTSSIPADKFQSLITTLDGIHTDEKHPMDDLVGRVYEYFLNKFAIQSANEKGEFYTPDSIVSLITELIEPYDGKIYDPCCGTGGMFVQSYKFVEAHKGNLKKVSVYGQESIADTWKLAKMNLAIRGISCNLGKKWADTFADDQHKTEKFEYIIANPPFNLKPWRSENALLSDPRWKGYETPPVSNANYAWILHMLSKLSQKGVAGFLLANGALGADGVEKTIREKLIENDKIEAIIILPREMFYYTDISVTLWIMRNNKQAEIKEVAGETRKIRNREGEILFMDLRTKGVYSEEGYKVLTPVEVELVKETYFNWQSPQKDELYYDVPEFCKSVKKEDIIDGSLVPSKYIEFVDHDLDIDYEKEMTRIQAEMKDLIKEEKASQEELEKAFDGIGYGIK